MQILAGVGAASVELGGYFAGGSSAGGELSSIDKITFPEDTKSTLAATLSTGRSGNGGAADSGVAGYSAGGFDTANISGIDKITFSADTKSTLA